MRSFIKARVAQTPALLTRMTRLFAAASLAAVIVAACDVHKISSSGDLTTLDISPDPQTLAVSGTQQFTAVGTDFSGAGVNITPVWTVVAGGGTISSTGLFTAGTTPSTFTNTVMATVGGLTSTATVVVTAGPLATITVEPNPATLSIGSTQQFTVVGRDASNNVIAITPTWAVAAGGGSINAASGLFTAGTTPGAFANTIRASVGAVAGFATVTVTSGPVATITVSPNPQSVQAGSSQQFTAVLRDASNNVLTTTPTWSVVNGGGTIGATTGMFTAGAASGTFTNTIRATSGAISGFATVTVTALPPGLATITVTPDPAIVGPLTMTQFVATGRDGSGNNFPISPVWAVVNGGGTIHPVTGVFTSGPATGTFVNTIRATSGTVSGFATVTVTSTPPALATITVTPNPTSVLTNSTRLFTATGRDVDGNISPIAPVWSVVNGGGSIDPSTGVFTAGTVTGTFINTVRATSGTISGFATVTVTSLAPAPLVNFGTAAPNGIMAGTQVTCVTGGIINADVSVSPGNTVTGFGPCVITGVQHLGDAVAAQAQIDLTTAYNTLAGLPCSTAIVANLGGTTKAAGVYCTGSSIGVTGTLTLDGGGDPNATFVFQAGTGLTTAGSVVLINGAQAKNVYWQVGTSATIGTASQWQGNIVALTSITLVDNATLFGRALARNGAVTLGTNNVITLP